MSIRLLKTLKSEKTLVRMPSIDLQNQGSSSVKNLDFLPKCNENLTLLQKALEETRVNFIGEKHQKLQKMSEIQDLYVKNHQLNKTLSRAAIKIKKKEEASQKLELENKKYKRFLEEIGVNYDKNEPFLEKIMFLEQKLEEKEKEIINFNEERTKINEILREKTTQLEVLKEIERENASLKLEIQLEKEKSLKISQQNNTLQKEFRSFLDEQDKKSKSSLQRISSIEEENRVLLEKIEDFKFQLNQSHNLVGNLTHSLISTETKLLELNRLKQANCQLEAYKQKKEKENLELNRKIIDLNNKIKPFIHKKVENIENLLCKLCAKPIEEAITVIPCGHSYCAKCEKGYKNNRCKCCGYEAEALYKNDLMNEMKSWFLEISQGLSHEN